jgi:Zn-dependent protease with chaperone function
LIKGILALLSRDGLPPNATSLRDNEYEADEIAVRFVHPDTAVSCLRRLSDGKDESPSHYWEFLSTPLPAMSVGERIAELRRRVYLAKTFGML